MINKLITLLIYFLLIGCYCFSQSNNSFYFVENIGQVKDQYGHERKDIDFLLETPTLTVYVGKGKLTYQWIDGQRGSRIEASLEKAQQKAVLSAEDTGVYYERHYHNSRLVGTAHSFRKLRYKNVYPHIDWLLKADGQNGFEYEFIVGALADPRDIRMLYSGQEHISLNEAGDLCLSSSLGGFTEKAPLCYSSSGAVIGSGYQLRGNVLSYDLENYRGALVIDPKVVWATYYGDVTGSLNTNFQKVLCDYRGNVYGVGSTAAIKNIATTGAYQTSVLATTGPMSDLFYVKFDSSGKRIYGTYFGSDPISTEYPDIALDQDTLYLLGIDQNNKLGTPGADQVSITPPYKIAPFVAKFDHTGALQWCTYIGGETYSLTAKIQTDNHHHLYVMGAAKDSRSLATAGTFRTSICDSVDGFLLKYNNDGRKMWGTYFGGKGNDAIAGIALLNEDGQGSVCVFGHTTSDTGIATLGSYQSIKNGLYDLFLVKFDTSGQRVWGTYVGGEANEAASNIWQESSRYIYISGVTYSTTGIATPFAYQTKFGGSADAALFKFSSGGALGWGTYIGGSGLDQPRGLCGDKFNNIYVAMSTSSKDSIADSSGFRPKYSGGVWDGFLVGLNASGNKLWASYYGGEGNDVLYGLATDSVNLYAAGTTTSKTQIATKGAFIDSVTRPGTTAGHGFLLKIGDPSLKFTSVKEMVAGEASFVQVYPNPVLSSTVHLSASLLPGSDIEVEVIDVLGRSLQRKSGRADGRGNLEMNVDVSSLSSGVYYLRCQSGSELQVVPFERK